MRVLPGTPYPIGATVTPEGVNFALFSANAEKVEVCLFEPSGTRELARIPLPERTSDIWHGLIPEVNVGDLYGYRVYGPYDPERGHRFNHHKLLLDPYARQHHGPLIQTDENLGYIAGHPDADLSFDPRDNAHNIPKCVVTVDDYNWRGDTHPRTKLFDSVIYETHIKGLTKRIGKLGRSRRGTYAAAGQKQVIGHLQEIGVTALEVLPIHTFVNDTYLKEKNLSNYWGYNSLSFFAADARYSEGNPVEEFRKMVKSLHHAGIELILDVVYNHTAEGNELGPTLCYRGIDNASYYRLAQNPRYYINDSGCGNTVRCSHPRVLQMIMDSLRYWVEHMHVDGFRFDLATIVAREASGYKPRGGFLDTITQDPTLRGTKLIAEPWDCGPGGYQLGNFPPGWSEWNDQYRDNIRKFWHGRENQVQALSRSIHGSSDIFEWQKRKPTASINFITSHDGYTLSDLVSYNEKHNKANGENNQDGHDANYSCNHGAEGPTDNPEINAIRNRQRRNLMATMLLSQGIPMMLAGDEFGHTQLGNNNAYCQDNETTWLDWSAKKHDQIHFEFVKKLIRLRKQFPVLRRNKYLHGKNRSRAFSVPDIQWFSSDGAIMSEQQWNDPDCRFLGMMICGDAGCFAEMEDLTPNSTQQHNAAILLLLNASDHGVEFHLPQVGFPWFLEVDTCDPEKERQAAGDSVNSEGRSLLMCSVNPDHAHS